MQEVRSLYIHFPFCKHLCNYCDFYKHKLNSEQDIQDFETLFQSQWDTHEKFLAENNFQLQELDTVYIGGGTPSLWGERGASFLKAFFENRGVSFSSNYEFTIEVDPDRWSEPILASWIDAGVNRISLGTQAFDDTYLKLMDRTHTCDDIVEVLKYLDSIDMNYSVDMMLGLPNSVGRNVVAEASRFLQYRPKHLSVYILKTRSNYIHKKFLPEDEQVRKEYLEVSNYLASQMYEHYEISNFAQESSRSRHNMKYWQYDTVAALGPNSSGLLVGKDGAKRYQWKSLSDGYQVEEVKGQSLIIEKLFLGLRTSEGMDLGTLFPRDEDKNKLSLLYKYWNKSGYLEQTATQDRIVLSNTGFLMCDSIIDDIFREVQF